MSLSSKGTPGRRALRQPVGFEERLDELEANVSGWVCGNLLLNQTKCKNTTPHPRPLSPSMSSLETASRFDERNAEQLGVKLVRDRVGQQRLDATDCQPNRTERGVYIAGVRGRINNNHMLSNNKIPKKKKIIKKK